MDDLGTPSPHKGSICYEMETGHFSICYTVNDSIHFGEHDGDFRVALIFGLDIGTTSIGFAVIDHDPTVGKGEIRRLGVRIFPEARDPLGTPLNQERRQARLRRRQLRRRRNRKHLLQELLSEAGMLPRSDSPQWDENTISTRKTAK